MKVNSHACTSFGGAGLIRPGRKNKRNASRLTLDLWNRLSPGLREGVDLENKAPWRALPPPCLELFPSCLPHSSFHPVCLMTGPLHVWGERGPNSRRFLRDRCEALLGAFSPFTHIETVQNRRLKIVCERRSVMCVNRLTSKNSTNLVGVCVCGVRQR